MSEGGRRRRPPAQDVLPGLCAHCRHRRLVAGARSVFVLCTLAASDPDYPRYPRLPVVRCDGYRPADDRQTNPR